MVKKKKEMKPWVVVLIFIVGIGAVVIISNVRSPVGVDEDYWTRPSSTAQSKQSALTSEYNQRYNSIVQKANNLNQYIREWNINTGKIGSEKLNNAIVIRNKYYEECMKVHYEMNDFADWSKNNPVGLTTQDVEVINNFFSETRESCWDSIDIIDGVIDDMQQGEMEQKVVLGLINILTGGVFS